MFRMNFAKLSWRFSRELFENPIELRQRLEPHGKRDFADSQIRIQQKIARFFESGACDVIDKVYTGHSFELLAQMIGADIDGLRDFRKRKLVVRMFVDEVSRFPDFYRLSAFQASGGELPDLSCGYHFYHPASSDFGRDDGALRPLAIARLILLGSGQSLNRPDFWHSNFCKEKANQRGVRFSRAP